MKIGGRSVPSSTLDCGHACEMLILCLVALPCQAEIEIHQHIFTQFQHQCHDIVHILAVDAGFTVLANVAKH